MALTVSRPKLNWSERIYLPAILSGLAITIKHFTKMLFGRTKVTMQYPEEKWDSQMPEHYRGAPALVRDETGRSNWDLGHGEGPALPPINRFVVRDGQIGRASCRERVSVVV